MANLEREVAIGSILASSVSPHARPVIAVSSPEKAQGKSHTVYKICGQDPEGQFEALRRFKDFLMLRSALVKDWPGCYIPQLPPKQMIVIST
jgi:hypothetical protein